MPQEDVLHSQLSVDDSLKFAAKLRFPADTDAVEMYKRIDEVLDELGLTERRKAYVHTLSGGQRKRLSVALELLTRPALLILDEPTSGLDPGNERSMMELLRKLADGGRTVIVVTHATDSLHLCDRVLFLARGGVPVFFGEPHTLRERLGVREMSEVFAAIERSTDLAELRQRFGDASLAPGAQSAGTSSDPAEPVPLQPTIKEASPLPPPQRVSRSEVQRQTRLLTERYVATILGDRRSLLLLLLQAPIVAFIMLVAFGKGRLNPDAGPDVDVGSVLIALVLGMVYIGASNSVREVVKERNILRREQNFGLSVSAYLLSKVIVLGVFTVVQSLVLVVIGLWRQEGPRDAIFAWPPKFEVFVAVSICGLSALCLGLLISSVVSTSDKAMTLLPVVLFAQLMLAGLVFPVSGPGINQLSWLTSTKWGLAALAGTSNFYERQRCDDGDRKRDVCTSLWQHRGPYWLLAVFMLLLLGGCMLALAWRSITRTDPAATLARRKAGKR